MCKAIHPLLGFLFIAASCGEGGPPPIPGSNSYRYSLSIPPGFATQDVQGIDSEVAEYRGDGVVLSMDHGMYSGAPACAAPRDRCVLRTVELDGREAQVGFYSNGSRPAEGRPPYLLHVHVLLKEQPTEEALSMVARCETRQACRRAWEIFKTVRFAER